MCDEVKSKMWGDICNLCREREKTNTALVEMAQWRRRALAAESESDRLLETSRRLKTLAREATNGWACYARRKLEHDDISRLHQALDAIELPPPVVRKATQDGER